MAPHRQVWQAVLALALLIFLFFLLANNSNLFVLERDASLGLFNFVLRGVHVLQGHIFFNHFKLKVDLSLGVASLASWGRGHCFVKAALCLVIILYLANIVILGVCLVDETRQNNSGFRVGRRVGCLVKGLCACQRAEGGREASAKIYLPSWVAAISRFKLVEQMVHIHELLHLLCVHFVLGLCVLNELGNHLVVRAFQRIYLILLLWVSYNLAVSAAGPVDSHTFGSLSSSSNFLRGAHLRLHLVLLFPLLLLLVSIVLQKQDSCRHQDTNAQGGDNTDERPVEWRWFCRLTCFYFHLTFL
jgi:hypothetical protein